MLQTPQQNCKPSKFCSFSCKSAALGSVQKIIKARMCKSLFSSLEVNILAGRGNYIFVFCIWDRSPPIVFLWRVEYSGKGGNKTKFTRIKTLLCLHLCLTVTTIFLLIHRRTFKYFVKDFFSKGGQFRMFSWSKKLRNCPPPLDEKNP